MHPGPVRPPPAVSYLDEQIAFASLEKPLSLRLVVQLSQMGNERGAAKAAIYLITERCKQKRPIEVQAALYGLDLSVLRDEVIFAVVRAALPFRAEIPDWGCFIERVLHYMHEARGWKPEAAAERMKG